MLNKLHFQSSNPEYVIIQLVIRSRAQLRLNIYCYLAKISIIPKTTKNYIQVGAA